jgi:hypothetical protein
MNVGGELQGDAARTSHGLHGRLIVAGVRDIVFDDLRPVA